MAEYILELNGISKYFPGVKALDNVHFQLKPGEIHALMGENGAGKSTFIKVITGVLKPEEGEIYFEGKKVEFKNTREAQALGIAAIYQHITCYPDLSVTENIFLGHEKVHPKTKKLQWKQMNADAQKLLDELGATFDAKTKMDALSVAQQQMVEIAKALSTNAKIVIMDEPTAALSNRECEELYKITLKLRDSGVAVIFISHRIEDMYRLASSVTVLRDSQYIGTWDVDKIKNDELIMAMVGREINQLFPKKKLEIGEEVLRVENLSQMGHFANVSFSVHKGEIMALTGLVGAGRTEVCEAIFGISHIDSGKIFLDGKEIHIHHPSEAIAVGIGLLPEDRQKQGLVLEWEISKNITLSNLQKYIDKGVFNVKKENEEAKALSEKLAIKTPSIFNLASSLSGGNQQKIVVAKMLTSDLKIIILDEPTKGVDVGAKAAIYEIVGTLAEHGYAIIMISSEMPEVLGMSDTIVVMKDGRVTATMATPNVSQEDILHASMLVETNQN
jgi:rhamnose transport system ATP-binding protein